MNYKAKNYKIEAFKAYSKAVVGGYNDMIDVFNAIKEVGKKMDGKAFNRRFTNAIEKIIPMSKATVSLSDPYNSGVRDLNIFLANRSYCYNGFQDYFDKEIHYNRCINTNQNSMIIGAKIVEWCDENIERSKKEIAMWEDASANFDKYTKQVDSALKQLSDNLKGLNLLFLPSEISRYDWEHCDEEDDFKNYLKKLVK